ncbi:unnamed protein product [Rhizophagus irregularis]|nr:unnamed protein product [Rhizophagus irregularis]
MISLRYHNDIICKSISPRYLFNIIIISIRSKISKFTYDPTIADLEQTEEDKETARLYLNQLLLLLRSCPLNIEEFKEGNNMLQ